MTKEEMLLWDAVVMERCKKGYTASEVAKYASALIQLRRLAEANK